MMPHAPLLSDVDEREAVRRLQLLDPCSAWRADLADAGLPEPMDEALADQWLLWLQIATVFDRLRALPVRARAAYARSTGALWETAERVTGASRFAKVGEVMATWRGAAPELAGFRELLWAVEQGEAEGALRVSYNCLMSLTSNLRERDIRRGYADAHQGRVLRTAGLNNHAQHAFEHAERIASHAGDDWLRVRVRLGLGALQHTRGNYPLAREIFGDALRFAHPHTDLVCGAHLGLVTVARAAKDYSMALEHGWHALQCSRGIPAAEVEALTILAGLSLEVGEFAATLSSCQLAMSKSPGSRMRAELVRYIVHASLGIGDESAIHAHLPALVSSVERTPNPWQEAQGRRVLAEVFARLGDRDTAIRYLQQTREIASVHGYNELLYIADEALSHDSQTVASRFAANEGRVRAEHAVVLNEESQTVLDRLACLAAG
ncbi:tetratricopeptide repeat protein [Roseisolibacter agri]|uniref:Tetratricopeptide repeat protein n=1 Tax=Roseisolibacter agri TaxID=2014610 RepID=A0AA37V9U3_9BACT|nr:hypothetical protein [Roseisolibacter agri]GLC24763.1 hypothetical protein rosag_12760 [Roseisolibacter agri]